MKKLLLTALSFTLLLFCSNKSNQPGFEERFFSEQSFWNQPIGDNPEIDARSDEWIALMKTEPNTPNIGINAFQWTIPIDHYRILKLGETVKQGDARLLKQPYW